MREKHKQEELKLFCQTCDQLICRDCAITEHRDHKYELVQDVYPVEKEKITKVVDELRAEMLALETSLNTVKSQEERAESKLNEVSLKVDAVINKQIEGLEKERQSLKDQLEKIAQVQKDHHEAVKKSLFLSLSSTKTRVEVADDLLRRGNQVEV